MNNRFVKALRSCSGQETSDRYRKSWIAQLLMGKKKRKKGGRRNYLDAVGWRIL